MINSKWSHVRPYREGNIFNETLKNAIDSMRKWKKGRKQSEEAEGIPEKHKSLKEVFRQERKPLKLRKKWVVKSSGW